MNPLSPDLKAAGTPQADSPEEQPAVGLPNHALTVLVNGIDGERLLGPQSMVGTTTMADIRRRLIESRTVTRKQRVQFLSGPTNVKDSTLLHELPVEEGSPIELTAIFSVKGEVTFSDEVDVIAISNGREPSGLVLTLMACSRCFRQS